MKAVWFETFGSAADALVFGDQPKPHADPGQVLVKLATTGVNPSDVKKRAGAFPNLLEDGPVIPHSDGAGVIEAVGEGVDASRVGERVFVYQAQYGRRLGTAAEFVAVESQRAPPLPDSASFEVGACIGIPMIPRIVVSSPRAMFAISVSWSRVERAVSATTPFSWRVGPVRRSSPLPAMPKTKPSAERWALSMLLITACRGGARR